MTEQLRDVTGKIESITHLSFKTRLPITLLIFLGFLAYSLIQMPVPAPNEPHYLVKAKHFWNPEWCKGDLFLESSNPHLFFLSDFRNTRAPFRVRAGRTSGSHRRLIISCIRLAGIRSPGDTGCTVRSLVKLDISGDHRGGKFFR